MNVTLTPQTANRKLGLGVAVSTTASSSCPVTCPFKDKGCYARFGPLAIHWKKIDQGLRGFNWDTFISKVKDLNKYQLFRHNQAGDLPHDDGMINGSMVESLTNAIKYRALQAWSYTHHLLNDVNVEIIKKAIANGFVINASTESLEQADKAMAMGLPTVVVMPSDSPKTSYTPAGNKVITCPAQYRDKTTCATCGLCMKAKRSVIIGFLAHGTAAKSVNNMLKAA